MPAVDSMEHEIKADTHDDSVLQQYPSPIAEARDTPSIYPNDPADHEQNHIEQPAPSLEHEQEHQHQHQHQHQHEHEHEHGQVPMEVQTGESEPPRPEIETHTITTAEELRIAAQLSQDLSQELAHGITAILDNTDQQTNANGDTSLHNGIAQSERDHLDLEPEQQELPNHEHLVEQDQQERGHHEHDQLAHHLSNHTDQAMSEVEQTTPANESPVGHTEDSRQPSQEQSSQSPFMTEEQQSLQQESHYLSEQHHPHQRQQLHQQFAHDQHPSQTHSQPLASSQPQPIQQRPLLQAHGGLDHISQQYAVHPHQPTQDNIPPRKRSKVSRACDECRRKKVKCDAASETGEEPCSNCRRSSIQCMFSRIPQKRGPSKGYIKELADRIHNIEGKLASEGNLDSLSELLGAGRRESSDLFSPSTDHDENSRKRPYSSISGADFGTPNPSRQGNWSSDPRPIQPYQTPSNGSKTASYATNGLTPRPVSKPEIDTPSRTASSLDDMTLNLNPSAPAKELLNDAFGVYLSVVHPCFPFLAASKERVEAQLSQCPSLLQDAFIEAFYSTMQSCVSAPGLYTTGDIGSTTRVVAQWESDASSPRSASSNLVHLQTLILMVIATDNYGTPSLKGEHGGPSKASILARAVGLAYTMRLHLVSLKPVSREQEDAQLDENIACRTWWTLVIMDRWHALSTASPLFIPNDSVVTSPELISVLGENVYYLAQLSKIFGRFSPVSLAPPRGPTSDPGAVATLNGFFTLSIDLFRDCLPADLTPSTHPLLHLVYWHARLLSYLFQSNSLSEDVLWACQGSAGLLLSNTALLSPLNHHFFSLTTLALLELARLEKTREEVIPMLRDLLEHQLAPSTWDSIIRDRITERLQPSTAQSTADQTLQHLAEMATTATTAAGVESARTENPAEPRAVRTSTNYADLGFDPRPILQTGYLNVLAGVSLTSNGSNGLS
ncbi:hypothetical protein NPX13_g5825 [Xylaria arbuscula]|uniref:Zn(2)-C6 fungal-type domain-containing protein n=1 Tax=Xylaria arbuscula TaxID=114810 RepID=A0A9W8TKN9_9PEZI|nr:hypothetical protein NPX13_g5825 [Xylaria arbuscula]